MKDTIYVRADQYDRNPEKYDSLASMMGVKVCTVDLNAGYTVPKMDKWGEDFEVGAYTEKNIRERFSLDAPDFIEDGTEDDKLDGKGY